MLVKFKILLRDQLGLPVWTVLAVIGLAGHVVLNLILRKPITSAWGLLAPLVIGAAVEAHEIWLHYRLIGLFAEGNDPLWAILMRHGTDVLKMLALPVLLVAVGVMSSR